VEVASRVGSTIDGVEVGDMVRVFYTRDGKKKSVEGDMLVAAYGPSSTIRQIFYPAIERKFGGCYVIRGTGPEIEASEEANQVFVERFTFFHSPGIQNLAYTIPGKDGAMEKGQRLLIFVRYTNFSKGSGSG
jgi:hypothetical protein